MKEIFNEHLRAFNAFYKELSHIYHEEALAAGISDSAFEVLYCLSTLEDGCCQKHIAQASFLSKQTINSSIKALEKKGWIELRKGKATPYQAPVLAPAAKSWKPTSSASTTLSSLHSPIPE